MTTLKDILRDMITDIRENEQLDYENQKDTELILEEYLDIISRRLIGKREE